MSSPNDPLSSLRQSRDGLTVYDAGLPRFPRNFTRDGVISALLADDPAMMRDQLLFCALHQGEKTNPQTGEELGKIHHEWPGYPIRGAITTYNACDAAAFFIIGHDYYFQQTADAEFLQEAVPALKKAVAYIRAHLNKQFLFEESPHYCGAEQFALKVTYWKDSVILDRPEGEPAYPAVFTLAHIQNYAALRCAARLLQTAELESTATKMAQALEHLFDHERGVFFTAVDQLGPIRAITSDSLHALYYLEPEDIPRSWVKAIELASEPLETSVGYAVMTPEEAQRMARAYHASAVWPFEQALIHEGAGKFGLGRVQRVCQRISRVLHETEPELVRITITEPDISSNPQLWTIAARAYFERKR